MLVSAQVSNQQEDSIAIETNSVIDSADVIVEEIVLDSVDVELAIQEAIEDSIAESKNKKEEEEKSMEAKMKALYNEVPLIYNSNVKSFIHYFSNRNRKYLITMVQRKNLYFPMFEEALKRHGMPDEIKYLPIVESGLNPMAISRAGAAGPWQFMPATGREMGLIVTDYIDERLDPYKSTDAACRYLSRLYRMFNDWELALASYNCGPGVVRRAKRQSGQNTFWSVYNYLPRETRGYVPQFVAVMYVMNYLDDFDMKADSLQYPMATDTILLKQFVNLHVLCEKLDLCYDDFVKLNPAIRTNILPENIQYPIRLPRDKKLEFLLHKDEIKQCVSISTSPIEVFTNDRRKSSSSSNSNSNVAYKQKIIHKVKSGEVLGLIAGKYGTSVSQIKKWNNLSSNTIRIGQQLTIYKIKYTQSSTTTTTSSSSKPTATPKYYYVKSGDSLWQIAKKFEGLTVEKIRQLNNIEGNNIKVGQKLILS